MKSFILGHTGMVGSALHRLLPDAATLPRYIDLRTREYWHEMKGWFRDADVLYMCAARVGGIGRNMAEPGSMIYDNLMIQTNVIEAARLAGVKLVVFLGSSCIYPAVSSITPNAPWTENDLLKGSPEPTNEPYAIAKIAGIKMLEAYERQYGLQYLAVMPCNLYGPGDNFDPDTSHFLPAMIRKMYDAKVAGAASVTLWGTGTPRRELMHVDDCARIIVDLVSQNVCGLINIGPGVDYHIRRYAEIVQSVTGYAGSVIWDHTRPDGVWRKLLDVSRMESSGIGASFVNHEDGIASTYKWFLEHIAEHRAEHKA